MRIINSLSWTIALATCPILASFSTYAAQEANSKDQVTSDCISSFSETRERVLSTNTQSVILWSGNNQIAPFITLQSNVDDKHYVLWQSLNGTIRGYALRDGKGFDYANNAASPLPLAWHPTSIWDYFFASKQPLKDYSCVLTGRTRVMGKRVSLLRFIPQEGLRYSFILAKEDESDFPIELSILDPKGVTVARLTTMDSRIIAGMEFPIEDEVFDRVEQVNKENGALLLSKLDSELLDRPLNLTGAEDTTKDEEESSEESNKQSLELILPKPTQTAGVTVTGNAQSMAANLKPWTELTIPDVFTLIYEGSFVEGGETCIYQEYSDGLVSFRVYRNKKNTIFYPVLNNGSLSIVRKNSLNYEYSVVGEVPVVLGEHVLSKITEQ